MLSDLLWSISIKWGCHLEGSFFFLRLYPHNGGFPLGFLLTPPKKGYPEKKTPICQPLEGVTHVVFC